MFDTKEMEDLKKQKFLSTTTPLNEITNENDASAISPNTPARKRPVNEQSNATPPRSSRFVKKLKTTNVSENEHLMTYLLGEISLQRYGAAVVTLQNLSEDSQNLDEQQLANIPYFVETLSDNLKINDPAFEQLQDVLKVLLKNAHFTDSDDMKKIDKKNQVALNRYKLDQAILDKNYEKAIDLFIALSANNARIIFSDPEVVNYYTVLTSNTISTEKSYKLAELQKILGPCIQNAEDLKESLRLPNFLNLNLQEHYYHNQSILHAQQKEYFHQIAALFTVITKAGERLKQEAEQPEQQQQTAIRIHQYLAVVEKIISENSDCEQFIPTLLIVKNNLGTDFLNISPMHCTANDWKMIDQSYYTPHTWTLLYNAALQAIKNTTEEIPQKIQTLILFMVFDQVSDPAITFLRIITLYQRLYNILQKTPDNPDNKVQFDLMLQNMDRLCKAIENNESISVDNKEAVKETMKTFLLNNIFESKEQSSQASASTKSTESLRF